MNMTIYLRGLRRAATAALLGAALLGFRPASAQSTPDGSSYINVRDFGAKGDGGTDDTAAIRAAFAAAAQPPYKPVLFPPGNYAITDTITFYDGRVEGVNAAVTQRSPDKDIFVIPGFHRATIRGLGFVGGRTQIRAPYHNTDQGNSLIERCSFQGSGDFAIRVDSHSCLLTIAYCHFGECEQVLTSNADWTTFRDAWISTSTAMKHKAVIVTTGNTTLIENIVGVPLVNGFDQRWIDNHGTLIVRNFRFGGEGGGFTPVVNWAKGTAIKLEDCPMWANGNNKRLCAVYCEEMPTRLLFNNCYFGNPPIRVRPGLDIKGSLKHVGQGEFAILIDDSNTNPFHGDAEVRRIIREAAKRDASPAPVEGQLSEKATQAALDKAERIVKALPPEEAAAPLVSEVPQRHHKYAPHTQKTDPADFIEFPFVKKDWDLSTYMDSTTEPNSRYIAVRPAGDDVIVLRRTTNMWAHVTIRNITVNLDTHPVLSWKAKDPKNGRPATYAVKVIHDESREMRFPYYWKYEPFFGYAAVDLREAFGLKGGTHTFSIQLYPLIQGYMKEPPPDAVITAGGINTVAGDFILVDFIRAEKP